MLRKGITHLCLLLCVAVNAPATPESQLELTVAIPEEQGAVSLTVFSPRGQLVRQLATVKDVSEFRPDLNGIRIFWDGLDENGEKAPPGSYSIRGWFLMPGFSVKGEAYYFNSWPIPELGSPIGEVNLLVTGSPQTVIGRSGTGAEQFIWRLQDEKILELLSIPANSQVIDATSSSILVSTPNGLKLIDLVARQSRQLTAPSWSMAYLDTDSLIFLSSDRRTLTRQFLSSDRPAETLALPGIASELTVMGTGVVALIDGQIYVARAGSTTQVPLPAGLKATSLAQAPGETFWATILDDNEQLSAIQMDAHGAALRHLALDGGTETKIFGSPENLALWVLETSESSQNARYLTAPDDSPAVPVENSPATSSWTIDFEASITNFSSFGFVRGEPVANGAPEEKSVRVKPVPNPLDERPEPVDFSLLPVGGSLWLAAANIPITPLGQASSDHYAMSLRRQLLRILVPASTAVAGFQVSGVNQIVQLEPGKLEVGEP